MGCIGHSWTIPPLFITGKFHPSDRTALSVWTLVEALQQNEGETLRAANHNFAIQTSDKLLL